MRALWSPVDAASVAVFRFALGWLVGWDTWVLLRDGWVDEWFLAPEFLFSYPLFEWVKPWPGTLLYGHTTLTAVAGLCVALGLLYRASSIVFFVGSTYLFLLDETHYLNHVYLIILYTFLLCFIPAHRVMSLDRGFRGQRSRTTTVPRIALWLLRFQMGVVYYFGGIAKLNPDWLSGWPLHIWLPRRADIPLIGAALDEPFTALLMSWSGAIIDLCAVPLLLMRRTRPAMFVVLLAFHLTNAQVFDIGVFPWLSIAATTLFFEPDWPRRWLRLGPEKAPRKACSWLRCRLYTALVAFYASLQLLLPIRHLFYPGRVSWTEEGHRFAWRMKLRDKQAQARFIVHDRATGRVWAEDPADHLTAKQTGEMSSRPYMIRQYASYLHELHGGAGGRDLAVYAEVEASLNGRPSQRLIDPRVDLARQASRWFSATPWIVPLKARRASSRGSEGQPPASIRAESPLH